MAVYPNSSVNLYNTSNLSKSIQLLGSPALILDSIKRGEDDEDVSRGEFPMRHGRSIIIRVYESLGGRAKGMLKFGSILGVKGVVKCNLLEDDEADSELEMTRGEAVHECKIVLRGFEVASFRILL